MTTDPTSETATGLPLGDVPCAGGCGETLRLPMFAGLIPVIADATLEEGEWKLVRDRPMCPICVATRPEPAVPTVPWLTEILADRAAAMAGDHPYVEPGPRTTGGFALFARDFLADGGDSFGLLGAGPRVCAASPWATVPIDEVVPLLPWPENGMGC